MEHECATDEIFVFGSNLAGRHGKGAAKTARQDYGAKWGQGFGFSGRSFAIPTKDFELKPLPLKDIEVFVDMFIFSAGCYPESKYFLTRIGCGLAGYKDEDIAPMFKDAPANVRKPPGW